MKLQEVSLSELRVYLRQERENTNFSRFPARIIIADGLGTWSKVVEILAQESVRVLKVSDFCHDFDVPPDTEEILSKIKLLLSKGETLTVLPVHEILRIYRCGDFLHKALSLETVSRDNVRLYIPLLGVNREAESSMQCFIDFGIRKAYPVRVLPLEDEESICGCFYVFRDRAILQTLEELNCFQIIRGLSEYIRKIETLNPKEHTFIVFSEVLFDHSDRVDRYCRFEKIENYADFIQKFLRFKIPIPYRDTEQNYWREILKEILIRRFANFEDILRNRFNIVRFERSIFENWQSFNEFERWLLFSWLKSNLSEENSYLGRVLRECSSYSEFEQKIWNYPLANPQLSDSELKSRIELIRGGFRRPARGFYESLRGLSDERFKLRLLCDVDHYGKRHIVHTISRLIEFGGIRDEDLRFLRISYPVFYYYIDAQVEDEVWKYFRNYILAKITNFKEKVFELEEIAKQFNLFSYPSRNSLLERFACKQVWIDGMGVEWIGLVSELLRERGYLVSYRICRANLPSTTEFNPFPESAERFSDLDEIYHKQDRDYPDFIFDEVDTLVNLVEEKVIPLVESYGEIVLTSDHGSTRFSGWIEERIDVEDVEIGKYGRYARRERDIPSVSELYELIKHDNYYYLISKTHRVFRGGKRTKVENHGGATLEEALVPVFHIKKRELRALSEKFVIINREISILKPVLEVEFYYEVESLTLQIDSLTVEGRRLTGNRWLFDLSAHKRKLKPGQHKLRFLSEIGDFEDTVTFKAGFTDEEVI